MPFGDRLLWADGTMYYAGGGADPPRGVGNFEDDVGFSPHAVNQRSEWRLTSRFPNTLSTSVPTGRPLTKSGFTLNMFSYFAPGEVRSIVMSMSVCLFVSVHMHHESDSLHQIFCACCLSPWLGPPLTTLRCVMYFQLSEWRHILIPRSQWQKSSTTLYVARKIRRVAVPVGRHKTTAFWSSSSERGTGDEVCYLHFTVIITAWHALTEMARGQLMCIDAVRQAGRQLTNHSSPHLVGRHLPQFHQTLIAVTRCSRCQQYVRTFPQWTLPQQRRTRAINCYIAAWSLILLYDSNFVQRMLYKDLYWWTIFYMYVLYSTFLYCVSRVELRFVNSK